MADVRRRADRVDAVFPGLTGHGHAVVEVDGAVVEPGQDVAVEVDHDRSSYDTNLANIGGPGPVVIGRSHGPRPVNTPDGGGVKEA